MAYGTQNAAYDLSLFDEELNYSTAAPKRQELDEPQRQGRKKQNSRNKVVTLPEEELNKIRRRKHNPLKLALGAVGAAVVAFVIGIILVEQVQLTELNQQIITAEESLRNAQSTYTQNQMAIQSKLSTNEIENYAKEKLGMSKAENAQKEYVSLSKGDKAEISENANQNFFQKIINAFTGLWS